MIGPESHPGVPLIIHLKEVAKNGEHIAQNSATDFGLDQVLKKDILFICGFYHDFGKATSFFQEYLRNPERPYNSLKNHALPSAIFAFYIAQKYLSKPSLEKNQQFLLSLVVFITIRRHHGNLGDFPNEIGISSFKDDLIKQFESIEPSSIEEILKFGNERLVLNIKWNEFLDWFYQDGFTKATRFEIIKFYQLNFLKKWSDKERSKTYYLFLWFFGSLLFSDKSDVILSGDFPKPPKIDITYLNQFRVDKGFNIPKTEINKLKNEAYASVLDSIDKNFRINQHIYSISLPTGLGKTLTSLGAALKLKEKSGLNNSKIIIAIPFTSIIDQNYEVYNEVFQNPESSLLLKHHHLTEPKYKEKEDSVRDVDQSQYLIETWQSSVVVTTFVQLIETLITNNKSKLLKISSLSNAVIILDEVQQIPHSLWELIRRALFSVTENLNCYIILMSATQPLIFHPGEEIVELVDNHQRYFSFFNRTKIINKTQEKILLEEFNEEVIDYAFENPNKDLLIILNTKKISLEVYRSLNASIKDESDFYYLTTLITPFERKERIKAIKAQSKRRKIIVSTQLVEAGVDISVDTVFRALAPLDSIIQAAGRANRYNEKEVISEVHLYKIDELNKATNFIYGSDLILKTENVLKDQIEISEQNYLNLIQKYFEEVKDLSLYTEKKILDNLLKLNFEKTGEFQLIESIKSESLFIALNNNAKTVWNKFVAIRQDENLNQFEKRKRFNGFKAEFYDYVINVNIKYGETDIGLPFEQEFGFYYIDLENQKTPIYNLNNDQTKNDEGFIFNEIKSLTF